MIRTPRITGSDLIAAHAKAGFRVLHVKGSHHFRATRMAEARSCLHTQARPSVSAAFRLAGM